ncbi:MAG: hypothetical protein FWE49_06130 [Synergistaceae bacterium]|nr:hypothetical protein [Synergistaceae bacterium]
MFFFFGFDDFKKDAVIIKLISEWNEKSKKPLGRTTIQKLCYFAEAIGVPLGYKFSVYQYGPYSQELYTHIDDMVSSGLVDDEYSVKKQKTEFSSYLASEKARDLLILYCEVLRETEDKISFLVEYFKDKNPQKLELLSTTHYYYAANKGFYKGLSEDDLRSLTIRKVIEAKKDRFKQHEINEAYNSLIKTPQFN